jgi:arylsulfatase A-like enzyme
LHCPYRPPPPFDTRFQNDGRYATGRRVTLSQERFVARDAVPVMSQLGGRDDYDYYVAAYDGCVAAADYLVARLVAELRRLELEDETVVVVTADHGESLGEEGAFFTHGDVLNPSAVHVPLVLRLPRAAHAGARVAGAVSLVDLAPTLLELAGVSPVRMAPVGRSLAPCFAEPARCAGGLAYSSAPRARQRSVATEQWFLRCGRESPCQLFDFADPASDRSGEYPAEAARLEAALAEWLRRYPEGEGPLGIETLDPETRAALEQLGYLH